MKNMAVKNADEYFSILLIRYMMPDVHFLGMGSRRIAGLTERIHMVLNVRSEVETMIIEMKAEHLKDINKPNEPFEVIGKIIPKYENDDWTFTEILYEEPYLKSYQDEEDEETKYLEYINNTEKVVYLYYQNNECVGQVKLRRNWNKFAYIEDIAVCKDFRGQGIGNAFINKSIEWAKHKNVHGLMLETQDNNLLACKFYHKCGFKIGAVDTMLYANLGNNFEKAVFWYLKF